MLTCLTTSKIWSGRYPFGSIIPNANNLDAGGYTYGFNGEKLDNEISGNGNMYDYGFRIYNPRLAKFLSVDPLTMSYPWYTPYQFAGNKPIWASDIDGLEEFFRTDYFNIAGNLYKTEIRQVTNVGAEQGIQTVHHTKVSQVNNGFLVTYERSVRGTTTGDNAFSPIRDGNPALSQYIRQRALKVNSAGLPITYQLQYPINVTTIDGAGNTSQAVAVKGSLVPKVSFLNGPFDIGFVQAMFDASNNYIGITNRIPTDIHSGLKSFGQTETEFNASNTNSVIAGSFATSSPALSPSRENNVPQFNDGVNRSMGSNFHGVMSNVPKGGLTGAARLLMGPRVTPGIHKF